MKSLERNMGTMWFPKYGSFQIKGTMYFLRLRDKNMPWMFMEGRRDRKIAANILEY